MTVGDDWASIEKLLKGHAQRMAGDPNVALNISVAENGRYVNWLGWNEGLSAYADAGWREGGWLRKKHRPLTDAQQGQLRFLGWEPPRGVEGDREWTRFWSVPVDVDEVVYRTLQTLREVYEAVPSTLVIEPVALS